MMTINTTNTPETDPIIIPTEDIGREATSEFNVRVQIEGAINLILFTKIPKTIVNLK